MKKASKVLVLVLVAVLLLNIFAGCGVISKNTEKYRATAAIQVGNETITIGKLIDTFNNYYNNYYSYISQGYISVDYLVEMTVNSLYSQYMKVDAYKSNANVQKYTHSTSYDLANAEYLTEDELSYVVTYIKYLLFTTLDGVVEGYIESDGYTLNDAEKEDTSRDFVEYDDLKGYSTYSEYTYAQNFTSEEMDKYIADNYAGILDSSSLAIDSYVYASEENAKAKLDALNERIDGEDKITFAQYKEWQEQALSQYKKGVKNNYKYDVETLVKNQAEDMILSLIVAKYNYAVYGVIDNANKAETIAKLKSNYEELKNSQTAGFNINNNFVSYIESLSDSSYIYNVPDGYNYIFVKNILIPFTTEQTTILSNLQKQLGSSTDDRYLAKRAEFASKVIADDFLSEKDADGKYAKVENIFALNSDNKLVVNPDGPLAAYFAADGKVVAMEGKTAEETIVELMKQYNTDVGQHSTIYDYVVRVGATPDSYTAKWVSEFVDAANEAYDLAVVAGVEGGYYALAVSSYGVHIVYYSSNVKAQTFDFDNNLFATDKPEYRLFKTYFTSQSSTLQEEDLDALKDLYYTSKITKLSGLDKFLKDNDLTFDFDASISLEDKD